MIKITNSNREETEFLQSFPKRHNQRSTIQHWQLRDLLVCPNSRKEFICVNQNNVISYNTESKKASPILKDLNFSPTSITCSNGFLAVGGQRSQLMVKQLNGQWYAQTVVGGSINNALCISNHPYGTRLYICNNDETIKIYTLPGLQRVEFISLPTAVNYASVSPDGRKMVAVGDSNQVFLYDISNSGTYKRISTLKASNDAGFSCTWNQNSENFAVASQDGVISVWDVRSSEKLAKITSTQYSQVKGACRCAKYSPSGVVDLLMFSEHVSYVNIVDARTYNQIQTVRVSPQGIDQHISGITFSPDSKSIFVGLENNILEYEVDLMKRRSFPYGTIA